MKPYNVNALLKYFLIGFSNTCSTPPGVGSGSVNYRNMSHIGTLPRTHHVEQLDNYNR